LKHQRQQDFVHGQDEFVLKIEQLEIEKRDLLYQNFKATDVIKDLEDKKAMMEKMLTEEKDEAAARDGRDRPPVQAQLGAGRQNHGVREGEEAQHGGVCLPLQGEE